MDVGLYVSELLNELNEVSLPGIGTFFKKKTSAYHDDRQGIFFPPSEEINFKADNSAASVELIQHICLIRNISEPSARYFTEKYSDSIRQSLQIKGFATIGTIGKLRTALNNGYTFEPALIENNPATYGLIPVMEIKRKAPVITKDTTPDLSAIKFRPPTPEPETEVAELPVRSYKTSIIIAVILLIISAFVVGSYLFYPQIFKLIKRTDLPKAPQKEIAVVKAKTINDSIATADSIMEKNFEELKKDGVNIEKSKDTINITTQVNRVTQDTVKLATTIKYEVISAAFHRKSEAEEYIRSIRKKGIDAHIVTNSKKPKYKISMASFTNNEAAQRERRRIREKIAKDAWILTIKNN